MINCPYCGKDIPEDTAYCPGCGSVLVSEHDDKGGNKGFIYKLSHPWFAVGFLSIVSIVLFILFHNPSVTSAESEPLDAAALVQDIPEAKDTDTPVDAPETVEKDNLDQNTQLYNKVIEYESSVNLLFEQAEAILAETEIIMTTERDDNALEKTNTKLQDIRPLVHRIKNITPPPGLERCQTSLVNSMSLIMKSIRSKMMYLQSGMKRHLVLADSDAESAKKQKEYAFEIINMVKAKYEPSSPAVPEQEIPQQAETQTPEDETASEEGDTTTIEESEKDVNQQNVQEEGETEEEEEEGEEEEEYDEDMEEEPGDLEEEYEEDEYEEDFEDEEEYEEEYEEEEYEEEEGEEEEGMEMEEEEGMIPEEGMEALEPEQGEEIRGFRGRSPIR